MLEDIRNRLRSRRPARPAVAPPAETGVGPIRYRPLLVAQLAAENRRLREAMRTLLAALGRRDEEALITGLVAFAETFRAVALARSVQFHPYLAWALQQAATTRTLFESVRADAQRCMSGIEAVLATHLGAPWTRAQRRRLAPDLIHAAQLLTRWLRIDEDILLPLYLAPGQYRPAPDHPGSR